MSPPGPKPRPVELQRQLGNPGHRELPDVVTISGKGQLVRPEHLDDAASRVWDELVPELLGANLVDRVDAFALADLCGLIALARHAYSKIEQVGYTVTHGKTGIESVSPWVRIYRDSVAGYIKLGEHFGLTPVARTRLGLAVLKGRSLLQELSDGLDADA